MSKLIDHLTRLVLQDNVIFFVGNEIQEENDDQPLLERIAGRLASQLDDTDERDLAVIAQDFEVIHGRAALVQALRDALAQISSQTDTVLQLLAQAVIPSTKIITTRFDQTIELALENAHKSYVRIVRDEDVPFFDESRVTLIKMRGDISQAGSLIVTENDLIEFFRQLPALSDVIRAFFATKTLVFIGYDLNSGRFSRFYQQIANNLSTFRRTAYALTPRPLRTAKADYWAQQNMQVHVEPAADFLKTLSDSIAQEISDNGSLSSAVTHNPLLSIAFPPLPEQPYKALESYTSRDVAIFNGREEESQRLSNRILANRLTVVYGESGSGKTSLLQAGVRAQLAQRRALLSICAPSPTQSLEQSLHTGILETSGRAELVPPSAKAAATLPEFLRHWQAALDSAQVLTIDQFEQFFIAYNDAQRQAAVSLLQQLLDNRSLDLHIVLVIREAFVGRLQQLENELPRLLDIRYRLARLGIEAARDAIEEPARLFGMVWDTQLVERLLTALQESDGIAPPQLQIVCSALYAYAHAEGGKAITLTHYEKLGGTAAILGDYIDGVINALESDQQATARRLLGTLVSSSGTRQRLTQADLLRAAAVDPQEATPILDLLLQRRLIRRFEVGDHLEYELVHDSLAPRIVRWLGDAFWNAQRAREILRMAGLGWKQRRRLLDPHDLRLVLSQQGKIHFTAQETALIYGSAVSYGEAAEPWRSALTTAAAEEIVRQLATHPQAAVRANIARTLTHFESEAAAQALTNLAAADKDANVRRAAVSAILTAPTHTRLRPLIEAAQSGPHTAPARHALTLIRDAQPDIALPEALAPDILKQVRQQRWLRTRYDILRTAVRSAAAGFLGFGLALGVILFLLSDERIGRVNAEVVVLLIFAFTSLTGTLGGLGVGAAAFVHGLLNTLYDNAGWRPWVATGGLAALIVGLSFIWSVPVFVGESETQPLLYLLVGALLGGLPVTAATLSSALLPTLSRPLHVAISIIAGMIACLLAVFTGAFNIPTLIQPIAAGLVLGTAVHVAFWPPVGLRQP